MSMSDAAMNNDTNYHGNLVPGNTDRLLSQSYTDSLLQSLQLHCPYQCCHAIVNLCHLSAESKRQNCLAECISRHCSTHKERENINFVIISYHCCPPPSELSD